MVRWLVGSIALDGYDWVLGWDGLGSFGATFVEDSKYGKGSMKEAAEMKEEEDCVGETADQAKQ